MNVIRNRQGLLFVLIGPGGVGKNTLMERVLPQAANLKQLPTATTRPPRDNEQHGLHRIFVSMEEFQNLIDTHQLVEHQEIRPGEHYGVPRQIVESAIAEQRDLIADIEVYGAMILHEEYPNSAVLIFITPPSMQKLEDQMRARGTHEEAIRDRMKRAEMEMTYAPLCKHIIVNDDVPAATAELFEIVAAEQQDMPAPALRYQVMYALSVDVYAGDQVLRQIGGAHTLYESFDEPSLPHIVAAKCLEDRLSIVVDAAHLRYAPLAGDKYPVSIVYDAETRLYRIVYHYACTLDHPLAAPDGWAWSYPGGRS